ncbi:MAG: hypothetical protein ACYC0V_03780 [Armatimonadota bacterium]
MRRMVFILLCLLAIASLLFAQDTNAQSEEPDTITISRSEFEELRSKVFMLEDELNKMKSGESATQQSQTTDDIAANELIALDTSAASESTSTQQSAGGKPLSLPDISLVVQAKGYLSSDKRDEKRNHLRISEAELAIQGYVYPNVKADAYFSTSPEEGVAMQVEEAYLTYLGAARGLNAYVGAKHVPFGRTNLMHPHSLLYARQPLALRNLVAEESLIGEGLQASYLLPTHSSLFAQVDLGAWIKSGHNDHNEDEENESVFPEIISGDGAGFTDRFNTARLWLGCPVEADGEIEVGASYANGSSHGFTLGVPSDATLTGYDISYRRFWEGNRRLLLRGESIKRKEKAGFAQSKANGYYLFGNYRPNKYANIGLLYDWSSFPQSTDLHESALSLILTKQMSERYYIRLQATHGSRPGNDSYNELLLQWVWGIGPHTHNFE